MFATALTALDPRCAIRDTLCIIALIVGFGPAYATEAASQSQKLRKAAQYITDCVIV